MIAEQRRKQTGKRPMRVLWTTRDASAFLGYSSAYTARLARVGAMPCRRVRGRWLFDPEELERWSLGQAYNAQPTAPSQSSVVSGGTVRPHPANGHDDLLQ